MWVFPFHQHLCPTCSAYQRAVMRIRCLAIRPEIQRLGAHASTMIIPSLPVLPPGWGGHLTALTQHLRLGRQVPPCGVYCSIAHPWKLRVPFSHQCHSHHLLLGATSEAGSSKALPRVPNMEKEEQETLLPTAHRATN